MFLKKDSVEYKYCLMSIGKSYLFSYEEEDIINHITEIMAKDYGITDIDKGIDDILSTYERENLKDKRDEILRALEDSTLNNESKLKLERELNDIIIKLAK